MKYKVKPTNVEKKMRDNDFIVSKTDLKGRITYCNRVFMEFAKYKEEELLGQAHSIIRHPDMPRAVFKLLWDTVQQKKEINAYVKNLSADGSFYWVFANITPVLDENGEIAGYYSVRRKPDEKALGTVKGLYSAMLQEESLGGKKEGMEASTKLLTDLLSDKGITYEELIFSL